MPGVGLRRERCRLPPLAVSSKIFSHPARLSASRGKSRFCSVVETRAYPIRIFPPPIPAKVKKPVAAYGSGLLGIKSAGHRSGKENGRLIYRPQARAAITEATVA
jgi:hypothetical protein